MCWTLSFHLALRSPGPSSQWRRERFFDVSTRRESSCLFRLEIQDGKLAMCREICLHHGHTTRIHVIRYKNPRCTFLCVRRYIYETLNRFWYQENDDVITTCHTASFCFLDNYLILSNDIYRVTISSKLFCRDT